MLMRWTVRRGVGVERRLDGLVVELQHSLFANSHWSSCRRATFSLDQCSSIGKAAGARINTSNAIHGGGNIIRRIVHNSVRQKHHSTTLSLQTRIGQVADAHLPPFGRCSIIDKTASARRNTSNAIHGGGNIIRRVVHNSLLTNPHSNTCSLPTRIGQAADAQLAPSTNAQALVKLRARVSIPRMPSAVVVTSSDAW